MPSVLVALDQETHVPSKTETKEGAKVPYNPSHHVANDSLEEKSSLSDRDAGSTEVSSKKRKRTGDIPVTTTSNLGHGTVTSSDKLWDQYYHQLVEFQRENGHINVPKGKLDDWVNQQRTSYNDGNLSQECTQKLLAVGVDVTLPRTSNTGSILAKTSGEEKVTSSDQINSNASADEKVKMLVITSEGAKPNETMEAVGKGAECHSGHNQSEPTFKPKEKSSLPESERSPKKQSSSKISGEAAVRAPKKGHAKEAKPEDNNKFKVAIEDATHDREAEEADSSSDESDESEAAPKEGHFYAKISCDDNPEQKWHRMFYQLVLYQSKNNGSTLVPSDDDNEDLAMWVVDQRKIHNNHLKGKELSKEQSNHIAALNQIGFCWDIRTTKWRTRIDSMWEQMYDELKSYKNEHGHCNVQQKEDPTLSAWVNSNRTSYRNAKMAVKCFQEKYPNLPKPNPEDLSRSFQWHPSKNKVRLAITKDRIRRLNRLGFEWDISPKWTPFEQRLEEFKAFKLEHGHGWVPQHYTKNKSLGKWVKKTRYEYKKFIEGKHSQLSEDRIQKLTEAGFEFSSGMKRGNGDDSETQAAAKSANDG